MLFERLPEPLSVCEHDTLVVRAAREQEARIARTEEKLQEARDTVKEWKRILAEEEAELRRIVRESEQPELPFCG